MLSYSTNLLGEEISCPINLCWLSGVSNFSVFLSRINNLELLSDYGCEIWKNEVQMIMQYVNEAQTKLQNLR